MIPFIRRVTRGLTPAYYFFHLFFGFILQIFVTGLFLSEERLDPEPVLVIMVLAAINTILYPYAYFVHEKFINFIVAFLIKRPLFTVFKYFFPIKIFTMVACWILAICIAPIGMFILYFYNKKNEPTTDRERASKDFPQSRRKKYEKLKKKTLPVIRRNR